MIQAEAHGNRSIRYLRYLNKKTQQFRSFYNHYFNSTKWWRSENDGAVVDNGAVEDGGAVVDGGLEVIWWRSGNDGAIVDADTTLDDCAMVDDGEVVDDGTSVILILRYNSR